MYDWNYESVNDHYSDQCHQNQIFDIILGKMLGGTNSLDYMIYTRGDKSDFDNWARIANDSTWQWNNVEPYYKKIEKMLAPDVINCEHKDYYGTNGMLPITEPRGEGINEILNAFEELGHKIVPDLNHVTPIGQTKLKITLSAGKRQGVALNYLSPIKNRPNLHVSKNTLVTKIIFDENKNAIGVKARVKGKEITIKASKEVIVSAGTFNSAKLLMLSGIGRKEHLEELGIPVVANLPVGENLQDHRAVIVHHILETPIEPKEPCNPYEYPAEAAIGHISINNTNKVDYETVSFIVDPELISCYNAFSFKFNNDICNYIHKGAGKKKILFTQVVNLKPKSRGEVTLRSSNPMFKPIIKIKAFSDHSDLEKLARYAKDFNRIKQSQYFTSIKAVFSDPSNTKCGQYEKDSQAYWECYSLCMSTNLSGFVGTCAMGSVVDGTLKVIGVNNLRVADGSIMPTITSARPSASIMMIGEKAAAFITKEHAI